MANHIMVDLETLDIIDTAQILSIGATRFNLASSYEKQLVQSKEELTISGFYHNIDTESYIKYNRYLPTFTTNPDTVRWWSEQEEEEAKSALAVGPHYDIAYSMGLFVEWLEAQGDKLVVWACSPSFDCAILKHHIKVLGLDCPWSFRDERDIRTFRYMEGKILGQKVPINTDGFIKHHALHDAIQQAQHMQKINKAFQSRLELSMNEDFKPQPAGVIC